MDKHYIALIGKDLYRKWHYGTRESRNEAFEKVSNAFEKYKTNETPFIEVEVGSDDDLNFPSMTFPLRLNTEKKDEVIKYIDLIK